MLKIFFQSIMLRNSKKKLVFQKLFTVFQFWTFIFVHFHFWRRLLFLFFSQTEKMKQNIPYYFYYDYELHF